MSITACTFFEITCDHEGCNAMNECSASSLAEAREVFREIGWWVRVYTYCPDHHRELEGEA